MHMNVYTYSGSHRLIATSWHVQPQAQATLWVRSLPLRSHSLAGVALNLAMGSATFSWLAAEEFNFNYHNMDTW